MQIEDEKRIVIAGGRDFNDYSMLETFCDQILNFNEAKKLEIVSGMAPGADTLAERYAKSRKYSFKGYPANWKMYGNQAGYVRNAQMAEYAQDSNGLLIAFWDMLSSGTKDMIQQMSKRRMPVFVCSYGVGSRAQGEGQQNEPVKEKSFDTSVLLTTKEVISKLKCGGWSSVELFNIMEQHSGHSELRYIWRYPISVGIDSGAYLVPVKEGILLIPYENTCQNHGDLLLLDDAYLSYADGLKYMAQELQTYAREFQLDMEKVIELYGIGPEPA